LLALVIASLALLRAESKQPEDLVEWRAWSKVTRETREQAGKPLFFAVSHELNPMSIAMVTESYQNESIAKRLNDDFIPIRIDKNEHPILAEFLFSYALLAKQVDDWPLNIVTTPDLHPIEGGGYYPPTDDWGSQGLLSVVDRIADYWKSQRDELVRSGEYNLQDMESAFGKSAIPIGPSEGKLIELSGENLMISYDETYGGFGLPPKTVSFRKVRLLDLAIAREGSPAEALKKARDSTLDAILFGAMRDYVRGGFYTATIEESWSIPDFRKSVLVQADAIRYLSGYPKYEYIVQDTARALIDDFRGDSGYYSEHISFFGDEANVAAANTWSWKDLSSLLKRDALEAATRYFGVEKEGNVPEALDFSGMFKERNILKPKSKAAPGPLVVIALQTLEEASQKRFPVRRESISPVTANAIVVSSLLKAGEAFEVEASRLLDALLSTCWDGENNLLRAAVREGKVVESEASSKGYALVVQALLDAEEQLKQEKYLNKAIELQSVLDQRFLSADGAYRIAPRGTTEIPLNLNAFHEDETGSTNSISIWNLLRLHKKFPDKGYNSTAERVLKNLPEGLSYFPEDYSDLLVSISAYESGSVSGGSQ